MHMTWVAGGRRKAGAPMIKRMIEKDLKAQLRQPGEDDRAPLAHAVGPATAPRGPATGASQSENADRGRVRSWPAPRGRPGRPASSYHSNISATSAFISLRRSIGGFTCWISRSSRVENACATDVGVSSSPAISIPLRPAHPALQGQSRPRAHVRAGHQLEAAVGADGQRSTPLPSAPRYIGPLKFSIRKTGRRTVAESPSDRMCCSISHFDSKCDTPLERSHPPRRVDEVLHYPAVLGRVGEVLALAHLRPRRPPPRSSAR